MFLVLLWMILPCKVFFIKRVLVIINQHEITCSFSETTFLFFWQHLVTEPSKGHSEGKNTVWDGGKIIIKCFCTHWQNLFPKKHCIRLQNLWVLWSTVFPRQTCSQKHLNTVVIEGVNAKFLKERNVLQVNEKTLKYNSFFHIIFPHKYVHLVLLHVSY